MKQLFEAFECLGDNAKKANYDMKERERHAHQEVEYAEPEYKYLEVQTGDKKKLVNIVGARKHENKHYFYTLHNTLTSLDSQIKLKKEKMNEKL